jgi:hypothetical protein
MLNTRLIRRVMPLKFSRTGLASGIDKDRPDYTVYCGEWDVGRIYQTRGGPESPCWFWSIVRRQGSLDRPGGLNKGEFLAHRNVHRSEDETANPTIEGTG